MATFSDLESQASVRAKINAAITKVDDADAIGNLTARRFDTVTELLDYSATPRLTVGSYVEAGGSRYLVVSSGEDVTTYGGDKLTVLPDSGGVIQFDATGAVAGAADHSTELTAALAALTTAGTNKLNFGPGTWRFSYETLPEGIEITGAPWLTIFEPVASTDRAIFTMDSGGASTFLDGPTFRNVTFKGIEATPTFSEQDHLVTLHGVDGVLFENCRFIGWRGDALYIGSSDAGGTTERHNRNVRVIGCYFDGVNRENRQAISCIDIDGIWIDKCVFANCCKSTMPGAIDFEPNSNAFHIIRNIWVTNNTFDTCGGTVGMINVFMPVDTMPPPENIYIIGNTSIDSAQVAGAGFFTFLIPHVPSATTVSHNINIERNKSNGASGQGRGVNLNGAKGVRMIGNHWEDFAPAGLLIGGTTVCRDIRVQDRFTRCGSQAGTPRGAEVYTVVGLDMTGSTFDDCGDGTANAAAINFKTGTSSLVKLNDLTVVAPTSKTVKAILKDGGHTFTPAGNEFFGGSIGAMANEFEAHQSDSIWTSYTPLVEGSSSAGTGTYTLQYGRYQKVGKQVFFKLKVSVSAGHTGTGTIEVGLPTLAASATSNAEQTVAISVDGAATTGGQVGYINPSATVGSLGCIRCIHTATGTLASTSMPAGAFTINAAGVYQEA